MLWLTERFLSESMVVKIGVMQIKERGFTETFHFRNDKDDLKGFQINFETLFYKCLSQSDTCQLESA